MKAASAALERKAEAEFQPTETMKQTKSRFMARVADDPAFDLGPSLTLARVEQVIGKTIGRWWSTPGFREWFTNVNEFQDAVEGNAILAAETLREIMSNPDAQPTARVNACKVALEVARKFPRNVKEDESPLGKMDRQQLLEFIRRNAPKLLEADNGDS